MAAVHLKGRETTSVSYCIFFTVYLSQAKITHAVRNNPTHWYNGQECLSNVCCCLKAYPLVPAAD